MARQTVVLSDMSRCVPASSFSSKRRWDIWNLIPYETAEHSGTAMYVGVFSAIPDKKIPDVTLSLNVSGWFGVYLGLWDPFDPGRAPGHGVYFRLSGDEAFQKVSADADMKTFVVQDGFWKYADLTGQELVMRNSPGQRGGVAWIRLEPVDETDVRKRWSDAPEKITIAKTDPVFHSPEAVAEALIPYRNTDFTKFFLAEVMDSQQMRSDLAEREADRMEAAIKSGAIRPDLKRSGMDWREWKAVCDAQRDAGQDVIDLMAGPLHEMGMELHAGFRVGGWDWPRAWVHESLSSRFHEEHPEWRCRDRDGVVIPRMSYAFPEVRDHVLALYRELAENHIDLLDGLYIVFIRGPVFLLYEQPLIDGFKAETGKDPREVDPKDEAWLRFRARFLTEFVRAVRDLRDELESRHGKRLEISANVFCSRRQNLKMGLDLESWIDEKLVDLLIPLEVAWPDPNDKFDSGFFGNLRERSGGACKVVVQMPTGPAAPRGQAIAKKAHRYYKAGMDGVFVWDINTSGLASFNIMRRMGHPDDIQQLAKGEPEVFITRDAGEIVPVQGEYESMERPGEEYGWWSVPPTKSYLIESLGSDPVGRYYPWSGG